MKREQSGVTQTSFDRKDMLIRTSTTMQTHPGPRQHREKVSKLSEAPAPRRGSRIQPSAAGSWVVMEHLPAFYSAGVWASGNRDHCMEIFLLALPFRFS